MSYSCVHCLLKLFFKQAIKPTVLIGTSGVGQTFTKEVVEAMATNNEVSSCSYSLLFQKTRYSCYFSNAGLGVGL